MMNLFHKPANLIVPVILFILLTPGLIVSVPSNKQPLAIQTLTHAAIFLVVYAFLRIVFANYY